MANQSHCRCRGTQTAPVTVRTAQTAVPVYTDPPVRHWPHPIEEAAVTQQSDSTLHYIRCALSYQNQMLADIKALLQQMVSEEPRKL